MAKVTFCTNIEQDEIHLLDSAAHKLGISRSEFVRRSAIRIAQETLRVSQDMTNKPVETAKTPRDIAVVERLMRDALQMGGTRPIETLDQLCYFTEMYYRPFLKFMRLLLECESSLPACGSYPDIRSFLKDRFPSLSLGNYRNTIHCLLVHNKQLDWFVNEGGNQ